MSVTLGAGTRLLIDERGPAFLAHIPIAYVSRHKTSTLCTAGAGCRPEASRTGSRGPGLLMQAPRQDRPALPKA